MLDTDLLNYLSGEATRTGAESVRAAYHSNVSSLSVCHILFESKPIASNYCGYIISTTSFRCSHAYLMRHQYFRKALENMCRK